MWDAGSLGEYVQNLVKTWEMEMVHKANPDDFKTCDPEKFVLGINGTFFSLNFCFFFLIFRATFFAYM